MSDDVFNDVLRHHYADRQGDEPHDDERHMTDVRGLIETARNRADVILNGALSEGQIHDGNLFDQLAAARSALGED